MFGFPMRPLEFDGALTPEETAEAAEIRALQFELLNGLTEAQLLGLAEVDPLSNERMQKIGDLQRELHHKIWDRHDPGAERRKAHHEAEMKKFKEQMAAQFGSGPNDESCDDPECETHGKKGLLARVKGFFSRKTDNNSEII